MRQNVYGGHTDLTEPQESSGGHNDLSQPQGIPGKHDDMDELQDEITATASRSSREAFPADDIQPTMTGPVLNEIISSKIARPLRTNPSIAETVDFYQANCNKRPAIYSIEKERKNDGNDRND